MYKSPFPPPVRQEIDFLPAESIDPLPIFSRILEPRSPNEARRKEKRFSGVYAVATWVSAPRSLNSFKLRGIEGNNFLHSWHRPIAREERRPAWTTCNGTHPRVTHTPFARIKGDSSRNTKDREKAKGTTEGKRKRKKRGTHERPKEAKR